MQRTGWDMRRDSFLRGAFILMVGSLISRVLGAVYRFVLPWLMGGGDAGAYGMALFGLPYSIYSIALVLSTMGIPLAVSKLVSEAEARGSLEEARRVFRISVFLLMGLGAFFSLILFAVSPYFSREVWQNPDAYYSMIALSPAVFFVALMSAFRGWFQGLQSMTPHATSQVVEQVVRVMTMFTLVSVLVPYGLKYAAAGATFGATTGALFGTMYLIWVYYRDRASRPSEVDAGGDSGPESESLDTVRLVKRLLTFAIPISISGLILPLMRVVDAAVVPTRLIQSGYNAVAATTAYGYLESYSMPFINVPAIFSTAVAISLVPSISASMTRSDLPAVREKTFAGLRIAALVGMPSAVGLWVLADEIPTFFWQSPEAGPVLASISLVGLLLTVQQVSSAALQGMGLPALPMYNLFAGAMVKLGLTWVLTAMPTLGVRGAGWATVVGFAVAVSLNLYSVGGNTGRFSVVGLFWQSAAAAILMGLAVTFALDPLTGRLGLGGAVVGGVALGVLVYGVAILLFGGIRSGDLQMIPRVGDRLAELLRKCHLLRR
ncbi:MAG: oligosaccharide flippase family protein [Clostridia bacterium]